MPKQVPIPDESQQKSAEPNKGVAGYDLTEERRKRCEPVIKEILKLMLDKNLLMNDLSYMEQMIRGHLELLFKSIIMDHFQEIFATLNDSLSISLDKAITNAMGKEKDDLTLKDVNDKLTNG